MGAKLCEYVMAHWGALADWLAALSEWQLVAVGLGMLGLIYVVYAAAWNLWLCVVEAWPSQSRRSRASSPRGGAFGRILSAPTAWDEEEPYQEWMAEVWQ